MPEFSDIYILLKIMKHEYADGLLFISNRALDNITLETNPKLLTIKSMSNAARDIQQRPGNTLKLKTYLFSLLVCLDLNF